MPVAFSAALTLKPRRCSCTKPRESFIDLGRCVVHTADGVTPAAAAQTTKSHFRTGTSGPFVVLPALSLHKTQWTHAGQNRIVSL